MHSILAPNWPTPAGAEGLLQALFSKWQVVGYLYQRSTTPDFVPREKQVKTDASWQAWKDGP